MTGMNDLLFHRLFFITIFFEDSPLRAGRGSDILSAVFR